MGRVFEMRLLNKESVLKWSMAILLLVFVIGLSGVYYRIYRLNERTSNTQTRSFYQVNKYTHDFSDSAHIVELGFQPLWIPASIITQVMQYDMVLKEMLEETHVELRFFPFFQGADLMKEVENENLEGGVAGDMPVLLGMVNTELVVVAPVQQGFSSIVSAKYSIIEDLRGKLIGCALGTNAHYGLASSMAFHGLEREDYQLVSMNIYNMIEALHHNEIDAFAAWEPIPSMALHKYNDQMIIHKAYTMGYLFFSVDFYKRNPEVVKIIVAAEVRAFNWLQSNRSNLLKGVEWSLIETNKFLSEGKVELTNYQLSTLAKKDILSNPNLPSISSGDLDSAGFIRKEFDFLKEWNFIADSVSWLHIASGFNKKILPEIQKNPNKYRLHEFNYIPVYNSLNSQPYD